MTTKRRHLLFAAIITQLLSAAIAAPPSAPDDSVRLQFSVSEGGEGPAVIGSVRARLPQSASAKFQDDDWSQVTYTLMKVEPPDSGISVDAVGNLRSDRPLSRERLCRPISSPDCREESVKDVCQIVGLLRIEYQRRPRDVFVLVDLSILVADIDNSAPRYQQSRVQVDVMENAQIGYYISVPKAEDYDGGGFASCRLTYRLEVCQPEGLAPDATFGLVTSPNENHGPSEVRLELARRLDRESIESYRYCIAAIDSRHTATVTVEVRVRDFNDNAPVWSASQKFSVNVSEFRPPDILLKLNATDADKEFGLVKYRLLMDSSGLFYVSLTDGELKLKTHNSLDYEYERTHRVVVAAIDNGEPPKSITATVTINVLDANDNRPQIEPHNSHVTITENNEVPLHFLNLFVTDKDSGPNGLVTCSLESDPRGDQKFLLVRNANPSAVVAYELKTNQSLDREERASYNIVVQCIDGGSPALTSTTQIYVKVQDQNDNAPSFDITPIDFQLLEDVPVGTRVHELRIIDPDEDSHNLAHNRKFSISSEGADHFSVTRRHGDVYTLTTLVSFDRESKDFYNFSLTVQDTNATNGAILHQATSLVFARILDANDCAPRFQPSDPAGALGGGIVWLPPITLAENASLGSHVTTMNATDCDLGINGSVYYEIEATLPPPSGARRWSSPFRLDQNSGRISLASPLDRDGPDGVGQFTLHLLARDRGRPALTGTARLTVNVADVNDNRPRFVNDGRVSLNVTCDAAVPERQLVGLDVEAVDADASAEHRLVRYRLVRTETLIGRQQNGGGGAHGFRIEPQSGQVYVSAAPEVCQDALYRLTLEVYEPQFDREHKIRKLVSVRFVGGGRRPGSVRAVDAAMDGAGGSGFGDGGGGGRDGGGREGGVRRTDVTLSGGDARAVILVAAMIVALVILAGLIVLAAVLLRRRLLWREGGRLGNGRSRTHASSCSQVEVTLSSQQPQHHQSATCLPVLGMESHPLTKEFATVRGIDTGQLYGNGNSSGGRRYDSLGRQQRRRQRNASLDDDGYTDEVEEAGGPQDTEACTTMPAKSSGNYGSQQHQQQPHQQHPQQHPPTYQAVMLPRHCIGGSEGYMVCQFPSDQWPSSGAAAAAGTGSGHRHSESAASASATSVGIGHHSRSCSRMIDSKRPSQPSSLKSSYLTVSHV